MTSRNAIPRNPTGRLFLKHLNQSREFQEYLLYIVLDGNSYIGSFYFA
jgi:hypothetical protein